MESSGNLEDLDNAGSFGVVGGGWGSGNGREGNFCRSHAVSKVSESQLAVIVATESVDDMARRLRIGAFRQNERMVAASNNSRND